MCYQVAYTLQCEHVLTDIIYCNDATVEVYSAANGVGFGNDNDGYEYSNTGGSKHHGHHHGGSTKSKPSSYSVSKSKSPHQKMANSSSSSHSSRNKSSVKGLSQTYQHSTSRRHSDHHPSQVYSYGSPTSSSKAMPPPPLPVPSSPGTSAASTTLTQQKRPCANISVQSMPYPTPPSFATDPASFYSSSPLSPHCPLRDCPFEQKQRCWNCCWCGKSWNVTGRCGCVMLIEGNQVRCEHICCEQCEPAGGTSSSSLAGATSAGGAELDPGSGYYGSGGGAGGVDGTHHLQGYGNGGGAYY